MSCSFSTLQLQDDIWGSNILTVSRLCHLISHLKRTVLLSKQQVVKIKLEIRSSVLVCLNSKTEIDAYLNLIKWFEIESFKESHAIHCEWKPFGTWSGLHETKLKSDTHVVYYYVHNGTLLLDCTMAEIKFFSSNSQSLVMLNYLNKFKLLIVAAQFKRSSVKRAENC